MKNEKRTEWGSRIGFILSYAGSAVGLGNIWKFPGKAYEGGGASFILMYLIIVAFIGLPLMITELSIGRHGKTNAYDAFCSFGKRYKWLGIISIITPLIIICYYSQVGGYLIRYIIAYITDADAIYARPMNYFLEVLGYTAETGTSTIPRLTLLCAAIFVAANAWIIYFGVRNGIEKINKIAMPALFVLLIFLLAVSCTLPGAGEGLKYLIRFDASTLTFNTFMSALGQAFYSLSLGMGITITYGSYLSSKENIPKNSIIVCGMDTLVALLAAFMIIPACFATTGAEGIGKGATFAFAALPKVFEKLTFGPLIAVVFYTLILFAALTSCLSLTEVLVAFLGEKYHIRRYKSLPVLSVFFIIVGSLYTCSQVGFDIKGIWLDFAGGLSFPSFGDSVEWLCDRILIPVCALGTVLFAGRKWGVDEIIKEASLNTAKFRFRRCFTVSVKFIAPAAIIVILIVQLIVGVSFG